MRAHPIIPPALTGGDRVAVVAPGFPARKASDLAAGVRVLSSYGLRVQLGAAVGKRHGYLAGTDAERARDLQKAIDDPAIRAILFARGGWGMSRLLDRLDVAPLRRSPKLLVGYSDLTSLFGQIQKWFPLVVAHGPMVAELGDRAAWHEPSFRRALFHPERPLTLRVTRRAVLAKGRARGRLLGGCLSLLAHLCGTGRFPDTAGSVIFMEDVGEEPFRVDRMLWQLRAAGFFRDVRAVLVGKMVGCVPRPGMRSFTVREVLADHLGPLGIPVVMDLPAGHGPGKRTLPFGLTAQVDTGAGRIVVGP